MPEGYTHRTDTRKHAFAPCNEKQITDFTWYDNMVEAPMELRDQNACLFLTISVTVIVANTIITVNIHVGFNIFSSPKRTETL